MARHTGRSRGCKVCIQRRVKCDETFPECSECLKTGWKCPGPLRGTLFVDMSVRVKHGVKESKLSDTPQPQPHKTTPTQVSAPLAQSVGSKSARANLLRLPSNYTPDPRDIFQQLYFSHLVASHDPVIHPWIPYLSNMLMHPLNTNFSTSSIGIQAASMALYSKLTFNKDLEFESSKWYSKGLEAQRKKLLQLSTTDARDTGATNGAICSAVVFSIFESIIPTTPVGWLQHIRAAERMLGIAGPERCELGLMHMYFKSIRLASLATSMILEQPSLFASEAWCSQPFQQVRKTPLDLLLDIALQLPSVLPYRNDMLKLTCNDPPKSYIAGRNLETMLRHILRRLDRFWSKHQPEIDPRYNERIASQTEAPFYNTVPFDNPSAATITSIYNAANVIALTYLASVSCMPETYCDKAIKNAASILSSVNYHDSHGPQSGGSFSMIFPMRIVSLMSPSIKQREIAHEALVKWGMQRGVDSVSITRVVTPE